MPLEAFSELMHTNIVEGARIGRYTLLTKLASGGMANVWLARVEGVGGFRKTVVVKTILPHLSDDPNFVRMFIDEALVASRIQHPNVVNIFDLGETEGSYYIAMEYIAGRTLRHVQRELKRTRRIPPAWLILRVMASACDGLHHAHSMVDDEGNRMHVVHRDVSPENIMISFTGDTKVLDFGIAKATIAGSKTRAGVLKGKHAYMAPEQIEQAATGVNPDPRIDVYSSGVVLYELLTGRRPFRATNELALLRLILDTVPPAPHTFCSWVPATLSALIMKTMARDPNERFQTAEQLRGAIESYFQSTGSFPTRGHVANYLQGLFGDVAMAPGVVQATPTGIPPSQRSQPDPWVTSDELSPITIDLSMVLCSEEESVLEEGLAPALEVPPQVLQEVDKGWDSRSVKIAEVHPVEKGAPSALGAVDVVGEDLPPVKMPVDRVPPVKPAPPPMKAVKPREADANSQASKKQPKPPSLAAQVASSTQSSVKGAKAVKPEASSAKPNPGRDVDDLELPKSSRGIKPVNKEPPVEKAKPAPVAKVQPVGGVEIKPALARDNDDLELPKPTTGAKKRVIEPQPPESQVQSDVAKEVSKPVPGAKPVDGKSSVANQDLDLPKPTTGAKAVKTVASAEETSQDLDLPKPITGAKAVKTVASAKEASQDLDLPKPITGAKAGKPDSPAVKTNEAVVPEDLELPRPSKRGRPNRPNKAEPNDRDASSTERSPDLAPAKSETSKSSPDPADSNRNRGHLWDVLTRRAMEQKRAEEGEEAPSPSVSTEKPPEVEDREAAKPAKNAKHAWDRAVEAVNRDSIMDLGDVSHQEGKRPRNAGEWFEEGLTRWRKNDWEGTLACWNQALELDPENRRYMTNLRKLKQQMKDRDDER